MKVCSKCKIEKDEIEFYRDSQMKDGLKSFCKNCRKINRVHKYNNDIKQKKADYYSENKKTILEKKSIYKKNNRCKINTYVRNKYYDRLSNKQYIVKFRISDLFRKRLKHDSIEKRKPFFEYTGIAYADYIIYFENNYPLEFAEITVKGKYHIDHIIPCAVYDHTNLEHVKLCWQPENLRIIPAIDNLKKSDFLDYDLIDKHGIRHLLPK